MKNDGFFAVDRRAWSRACDLGLAASAAYLVMARGTARDNRTSTWSVKAVLNYTGMRHSRSGDAVTALIESGLVRHIEGGARPSYYLAPAHDEAAGEPPDWIWLPNTIIDGAADEKPPIQLLRQAESAAALRLFIDLYHAQNLADNSGVHWRMIRRGYTREKVGESGPWVVFGFQAERLTTRPTEAFVAPHITTGRPKQADLGKPFFDTLDVVEGLGLVEFVAHLVTANNDTSGEIEHPYAIGNGEPDERAYVTAAVKAAEALLIPEKVEWARARGLHLLPVRRHMQHAELVGIARLYYRPKTRMTAAWLAQKRRWADSLKGFAEVCSVTLQRKEFKEEGFKEESSRKVQGSY